MTSLVRINLYVAVCTNALLMSLGFEHVHVYPTTIFFIRRATSPAPVVDMHPVLNKSVWNVSTIELKQDFRGRRTVSDMHLQSIRAITLGPKLSDDIHRWAVFCTVHSCSSYHRDHTPFSLLLRAAKNKLIGTTQDNTLRPKKVSIRFSPFPIVQWKGSALGAIVQ